MNPASTTLKFIGVAAISAVLAYVAWDGSQPSDIDGFGDVGQLFFPDFDDVGKATALTVVDYDEDEKAHVTFEVRQNDDDLWVIPSHHNYPAEAADRLAKTATSLLGVRKTAVKSRFKDDWKRFGVVAPDDEGTATAEERGTRLTLSDGSGNPLVNLIIGSKVDGQDNQYHVRETDKNTTYVTELDVDLSAKFSDWIEPDLLKIAANDLITVTLDNYSVDEQRGTVDKTELLEFAKKDLKTAGDWTLRGLNDETEELDQSPVTSIATNLDQLKIVGVRPKPEGLDDNLNVHPAVRQILEVQMQSLGYFIGGSRDGKERLFANEGELSAGTESGVEYTLYFGEIARGSDKDIEVGLSDESAISAGDEGDSKDKADETASEDGPRRYLLIKAKFNEALLGDKPVAPTEPQMPEILTEAAEPGDPEADDQDPEVVVTPDEQDDEPTGADENPSEPAADNTDADETSDAADAPSEAAEPEADLKAEARKTYDAAVSAYEAELKTYEADLQKFEKRVESGTKKAEELALRFSGWYYVISSDSFEKFRIARKDVVSVKEVEKPDATDGDGQ